MATRLMMDNGRLIKVEVKDQPEPEWDGFTCPYDDCGVEVLTQDEMDRHVERHFEEDDGPLTLTAELTDDGTYAVTGLGEQEQ